MASRVEGPREARAAVVALRSIDADTRKAVNASVRSVVNPMWQQAVQRHTRTHLDRRVIANGARVAVGARPTLTAAKSSRPLRGGLVPSRDWRGFEFGTDAQNLKRTYQTRSPNGTTYSVTRRTRRQVPRQSKSGRVAYQALGDIGARVFALWAQTTNRLIFEAFEKGGK